MDNLRNLLSAATSMITVALAIYLLGGALQFEMAGGLLIGGIGYLILKAAMFFSQSVNEKHEPMYDIIATMSIAVITIAIFVMQLISEPANELPYMALVIVLASFTLTGMFTIVFRVTEQIWPL